MKVEDLMNVLQLLKMWMWTFLSFPEEMPIPTPMLDFATDLRI